MGALDDTFVNCRAAGRPAFIAYLTAGDPDLETTARLLPALVAGGADIIELGVPFSDPIADGPVNQRAAVRALDAGTTLDGILDLVARQRDELGVPIVLFTYYNPIHARGVETFAEQASASGVDGVLCLDRPPDEVDGSFIPTLHKHGLDTIFLLAPTSTKERVRKIAEASSGFVYYVARTGVTGAGTEIDKPLLRRVRQLRRKLKQPLAVGFGLGTPERVRALAPAVDGVVVGSALVELVEQHATDDDLTDQLEAKVRTLTGALRN
ncbi:MAG: tryptophan synthase subunit alpha [Acidobacteriota bacterium]